jgi:hypothetical protein
VASGKASSIARVGSVGSANTRIMLFSMRGKR